MRSTVLTILALPCVVALIAAFVSACDSGVKPAAPYASMIENPDAPQPVNVTSSPEPQALDCGLPAAPAEKGGICLVSLEFDGTRFTPQNIAAYAGKLPPYANGAAGSLRVRLFSTSGSLLYSTAIRDPRVIHFDTLESLSGAEEDKSGAGASPEHDESRPHFHLADGSTHYEGDLHDADCAGGHCACGHTHNGRTMTLDKATLGLRVPYSKDAATLTFCAVDAGGTETALNTIRLTRQAMPAIGQ